MKHYEDSVTQETLDAATNDAVARSAEIVAHVVSEIDTKQTEQIKKLRTLLAASFAFNVALTLVVYFVK